MRITAGWNHQILWFSIEVNWKPWSVRWFTQRLQKCCKLLSWFKLPKVKLFILWVPSKFPLRSACDCAPRAAETARTWWLGIRQRLSLCYCYFADDVCPRNRRSEFAPGTAGFLFQWIRSRGKIGSQPIAFDGHLSHLCFWGSSLCVSHKIPYGSSTVCCGTSLYGNVVYNQ